MACGLLPDRNGDGVFIILNKKDHRKFFAACPIQRFMEIPLGGRTFAGGYINDLVRFFFDSAHRAPDGL